MRSLALGAALVAVGCGTNLFGVGYVDGLRCNHQGGDLCPPGAACVDGEDRCHVRCTPLLCGSSGASPCECASVQPDSGGGSPLRCDTDGYCRPTCGNACGSCANNDGTRNLFFCDRDANFCRVGCHSNGDCGPGWSCVPPSPMCGSDPGACRPPGMPVGGDGGVPDGGAPDGGAPDGGGFSPTPRTAVGAAAIGGKIYLFGGATQTTVTDEVDIFDSATGTWSAGQALPTPRAIAAVVVGASGLIYVIGGQAVGNPTNVVEAYVAKSDRWTTKAGLPAARAAAVAVADKAGVIHVFGGYDATKSQYSNVYFYDEPNDQWKSDVGMPDARGNFAGALAGDDNIYIVGGSGNSVLRFTPSPAAWSPAPAAPTGRYSLAAASGIDGRVYVFGGTNGAGPVATVEVYDPSSLKWMSLQQMPSKRQGLAAVRLPATGHLFAIFGSNSTGPTAELDEYDPVADKWTVR